jgi:maltooligosyltrehalose trehalohydrolase
MVWAPERKKMIVEIVHPEARKIEMKKDDQGYFTAVVENVAAASKYFYRPDDQNQYPDPASHSQPEGVHGPSEVIDHNDYDWRDEDWRGLPLKDLILYELHVGTFTQEGTFEAVIPRLDELKAIGVNAIELMPVAQFPGNRNWGYDSVFPYAVQNSYGGPTGLKKLVDECHVRRIAVFLDVIYNHLGPEGNYFSQYGPYFTDKYQTPWGQAINFDGDWSDGVRDYFSENPIHWFENYHIDGLRLDAIHSVFDSGAVHFWEFCNEKVKQAEARLGRKLYMVAESDLNSPRVVNSPDMGGYGFDAQWLDDFHHALYVILDKKGKDRYEDFGRLDQLAKAYQDGFVHSGEYVKFRKRKHGRSSAGVAGDKFVVFNQNHDQVGNRVMGERLCMLVDFERQKLAAAALLLAPYVPMLFMGEEYADQSPFFYFVSHSDPNLIKAVQEGRKKEFENFNWEVEPPDPQNEKTFNESKLKWHKREQGEHKMMLEWHKALITLRRSTDILQNYNKNDIRVTVLDQSGLELQRQTDDGLEHCLCLFNFSDKEIAYTVSCRQGAWKKSLDSKEKQWLKNDEELKVLPDAVNAGDKILLPPLSVVVYL